VLAEFGSEAKAAMPVLIETLKDKDGYVGHVRPDVRLGAPEALKKIGSAAVPASIEANKDENANVRAWMAITPGRYNTGCFLMIAVFGRSGGDAERLFQEGDADPLGPPHLLEHGASPRSSFHHLGKQRQPDTDDLSFLGQAADRSFQKLLVVSAEVAAVFGQTTESPAESLYHFFSMSKREKLQKAPRL
jgi:hypothetical protein